MTKLDKLTVNNQVKVLLEKVLFTKVYNRSKHLMHLNKQSFVSLWQSYCDKKTECETLAALLENERSLRRKSEELLRRLVYHDRAAAKREGLDGCLELQYAEDYLEDHPFPIDEYLSVGKSWGGV